MKGTVKWYNARKGYGFITPEDNSDDVFVHAVTLKSCGLNKLFTGSEVTFEVENDDKGKRAKDLKVTKEVKPEPGQPPTADKKVETKKESPKKESPKKESPKKESPKKESSKKESPKKEAKPKKTKVSDKKKEASNKKDTKK